MSSRADSSGPLCPRCRRRIAAWKLEHCVYCGEVFPPDLKEGFEAPDALKWAERPALPGDLARQLEMLKVVRLEKPARSPAAILALLAVPMFGVLFFLLYRIVARYSPASAVLVLVAGLGFLTYLVWSLFKRTG